MSIAVSSVVKPSRLLRAMVGCLCRGTALIGCLLGLGQVGNSLLFPRVGAGGVCIIFALLGFCRIARNGNIRRIDISGTGQIRLTEYQTPEHAFSGTDRRHNLNSGAVVRLMADSTIWPNLLLLRLQAEDRKVSVLSILPDSVTANDFRALSVACRWIALREQDGGKQNFVRYVRRRFELISFLPVNYSRRVHVV